MERIAQYLLEEVTVGITRSQQVSYRKDMVLVGKTYRDRKRAGARVVDPLHRRRGKGSLGQGRLMAVECRTEGCFNVELMPEDMMKVTCSQCVQRLVKGTANAKR